MQRKTASAFRDESKTTESIKQTGQKRQSEISVQRRQQNRFSYKSNIMEKKKLLKSNGFYNLVQLKTHLQDEGILELESMHELITKFTSIVNNQPNFIKLNGSITIIGDIHGQYYDFLKILTKVGDIEQNFNENILFLGDYVDRGTNSVEVMTFIMALKVNFPQNVILLRGNHESRVMTNSYNFMKEVVIKYNQNIYERFTDAFDGLPLACLVNKSFFCVHGGISEKMLNVEKINEIDRFKQIPLEGAFCDFIWADPVQIQDGYLNNLTTFNQSRQCSIYFGKDLTQKFTEENSIKSIIRAHEVFPQGYNKYCWGQTNKVPTNFPSVITVFSAPNYCGVYGNKGAIIKIEGTNFQIKQFKQQVINNRLYSYLEVFQWSVPQITRVINQFTKAMMTSILQVYLKQQFPSFKSSTHYERLKVLLDYIKNHTDILQRQQNQIFQSALFPNHLKQKEHEEGSSSVFDRSREYFRRQHSRPGGQDSFQH